MRSSWPFFSVSEIFEYVFLDSHTYSKAFFEMGCIIIMRRLGEVMITIWLVLFLYLHTLA